MVKGYAALEAGGELQEIEYDLGSLGETEVEIDVRYCGICHSDLSAINNEWGMSEYPLVAGHEVVGTVARMGAQVKNLQLGDNVGLGWHCRYCHNCDQCETGDNNLCATAEATFSANHKGGFGEKVYADYRAVFSIPEGLDLESTGPLFCGGITVFNPIVQFDISPLSKVAVIGIGGLGHMALSFLNAWGCHVTAFTSSERKIKEAIELGAHATLNSRDENEIAQAENQFDLIISTVNVKLDWNLFIQTLKPKGRLHLVGAVLEPLDLQIFPMLGKQISVSSSPVGAPKTIKAMLDFANLHDVAPMVEVFPFSEINQAMQKLDSGDVHYRIVLKR